MQEFPQIYGLPRSDIAGGGRTPTQHGCPGSRISRSPAPGVGAVVAPESGADYTEASREIAPVDRDPEAQQIPAWLPERVLPAGRDVGCGGSGT
jgi:hypothetical protein